MKLRSALLLLALLLSLVMGALPASADPAPRAGRPGGVQPANITWE